MFRINSTSIFIGSLLFCLSSLAQGAIDYHMTVAQDGTAEYKSIQAAIDNAKAFVDKPITIQIKNGIYHEKVHVYEWTPKLTFVGESVEHTIIRYGDHFNKLNIGRNSTFHTPTLQVDGNDFHAYNLTVENTAGEVGQAVAVAVNADRVLFDNVKLLGNQDTLYVTGEGKRSYFKNCYVEGTTDFIFGGGTAVFDHCTIHAKSNSYITAASTPEKIPYGLVFIDSKLTAAEGVSEVYLGRPWREFAKTVFINTQIDAPIVAKGWDDWSKPNAHNTTFYAEYASKGKGANTKQRVSWSHQLSEEQAALYTLKMILGRAPLPLWYQTR
ncbi:pectinesterase family protein [Alteromonadaceae bacterium BrNp21-10]|nr:pectinesterase family protein [Alteromonadaceae bacterium BrNp21-10]